MDLTDNDAIDPGPGETEDAILGGRIRLRQPRDGYRAGMDAAFLAAACAAADGARVIEAGCGAGAALLAAASRLPGAKFTGVEKDARGLALALANIAANEMGDRTNALIGDVEAPFSKLGLPVFDAAMANPPFFDDAAAIRGPSASRRAAWITEGGLSAWIGFLIKAVREGGVITLIHRADRLGDIIGLLAPKAGSVQIRPIAPFADAPAKRVVVRAVKTGRSPLRLLPPLILHERGSEAKHTPQAEAILRGDASLDWF